MCDTSVCTHRRSTNQQHRTHTRRHIPWNAASKSSVAIERTDGVVSNGDGSVATAMLSSAAFGEEDCRLLLLSPITSADESDPDDEDSQSLGNADAGRMLMPPISRTHIMLLMVLRSGAMFN